MLSQSPPESFDPFMLAVPLLWIIIFVIVLILIRNGNLTKTRTNIVLIISFIAGGFILGARPNPVNAINQFFINLSPTAASSFRLLLASIGILFLLLASTVLFSRIFCGYACPLGAMQELASKVKFKSNLKDQRRIKFVFDPPEKTLKVIRWIYFVVFAVTAVIWGLSISQFLDPFTGFQVLNVLSDYFLLITVIFLLTILVSSFFIYRPWCRLLCPFGALSGSISSFNQIRYIRTDKCTDCGLCEKICPSHAAYRDSKMAECYYCNRCVEICPHEAIVYARATAKNISSSNPKS